MQANGPIARPVGYAYVWGDALDNVHVVGQSAGAFRFDVDVSGQITSQNTDAATTNGSTLTFNTVNITIDPTDYTGSYQATGNGFKVGVSN